MVLRLLLALLFTVLVAIGSSVIVYRGWQINNPTAPGLDVKSLIKSPEQVTSFAGKLTADDVVNAVTAAVTGEPTGQAAPTMVMKAAAPAPITRPVAPAPAPVAPPVVAAAPVESPKAPVAPAPLVPVPDLTPDLRISSDLTPAQRGCVVGGAAGTGAALVIGPGQIASAVTGSALPPTTRAIGTVLGAALLGGCAAGYVVVPSLNW